MTVEDTGVRRLVTKPFIVDLTLSFTEAESRINSELKAHIKEEFKVVNIRVTNYLRDILPVLLVCQCL
jgi:hypothetical protein